MVCFGWTSVSVQTLPQILTRLQSGSLTARKATRQVPPTHPPLVISGSDDQETTIFFEMRRTDARPTSGRAASGSGGKGGTSLRGKRHDLQDRQRRPRPVGRQLLVGDASSLRAATPSCGFSRSSTHRAPWGVAPATPRTNWCVSCAAALSSPSSSSSLWALTKLALSCGFSRSSTHPARTQHAGCCTTPSDLCHLGRRRDSDAVRGLEQRTAKTLAPDSK